MGIRRKELLDLMDKEGEQLTDYELGSSLDLINFGILKLICALKSNKVDIQKLKPFLDDLGEGNAEFFSSVSEKIINMPEPLLHSLALSLPIMVKIPPEAANQINEKLKLLSEDGQFDDCKASLDRLTRFFSRISKTQM